MTFRMAGLLIMLASLVDCSSSRSTPSGHEPARAQAKSPTTRPMLPKNGQKPAAKSPEPRLGARVFLDTSGSMSGFFGARGPQGLSKAILAIHSEIDGALAEQGLGTPKKCTLGQAVQCKDIPNATLASPVLYRASASRLDLLLKRRPLPARIDPNDPPDPDYLDAARLTLLVTDGMQAAGPPSATGADEVCSRGADPTCVGALLRARIGEGYGVWLVGVLLPFSGAHYPERPITKAYFAKAKAHVNVLKFDAKNLGVKFAITGALRSEKRTGNSTYRYKGYKPLLIAVFSRKPQLGRGLVAALVKKLEAAPIQPGSMRPADTVVSLELAPLTAPTFRPARFELAPRGQQEGIPPSALAEIRLEAVKPFDGGLSAKVWCGRGGRALFNFYPKGLGRGVLPPYFKSKLALLPPPAAPGRSVAPPVLTRTGQIRTGVNCAALPKGHTALRFQLELGLSFDANATQREWWSLSRWSSEDTWMMPERLFGLHRLVLPVLRERAARLLPQGVVVVHVYRH